MSAIVPTVGLRSASNQEPPLEVFNVCTWYCVAVPEYCIGRLTSAGTASSLL